MKFLCIALLGLFLVAHCSAQTQQQRCADGSLGEGYFPHDRYCNKFFVCTMGMWLEYSCGAGYLWHAADETCRYPNEVNCGTLVSSNYDIQTGSAI